MFFKYLFRIFYVSPDCENKNSVFSTKNVSCIFAIFKVYSMNFGSEMVSAKHVSGKNIFFSMNKDNIREERIFEIVHCPFKGRAKLHHLCQPNGQVGQCKLGGNLKGQCTTSKILFPLILYAFTEKNIIFPETCFAYHICEQKFAV